jgi:hypothetical protein
MLIKRSCRSTLPPKKRMLTIEPRMVVTSWVSCPISFKHMSLWDMFLDLHLTMYHSNIGVMLLSCWNHTHLPCADVIKLFFSMLPWYLIGMWVLSPTYVSKPQHGGKVPTFEPQESIKIWFTIINIESYYYSIKIFMGLALRVGSSFCSTQLSTQVPSLTSKKCCHVNIHVIRETWDLGPVWSGKSQLSHSQRPRLHGLIDLAWLGT